MTQDRLEPRGHATECRIIAEDPLRNFTPSPGTIRSIRRPCGPGVRFDDAVYSGYTVPVHYDPMVAKLITWGDDRIESINRMARALDELRLDGLTTSVGFHRKVMAHPAYLAAELHTGFLEQHPELLERSDDDWLNEIAVVAAAVHHLRRTEADSARSPRTTGGGSAWKWHGRSGGWR